MPDTFIEPPAPAAGMATIDDIFSDLVEQKKWEAAQLYFYYSLDFMIELAYRISHDFFLRPHLYIDAGGAEPARVIGTLRASYGKVLELPDQKQRECSYHALFGPHLGLEQADHDFVSLRNNLLLAASAFAERVFNSGEDMLRQRVRTVHRPLKSYLEGSHGDSLKLVTRDALPIIGEDVSFRILRTKGIAGVFSITIPAKQRWPYEQDSNGDKLIEMIAKDLGNPSPFALRREMSNSLQRVATLGAEAIAAVIDMEDSSSDAEIDRLIGKCYTWGAALNSLGPVGLKALNEGDQPMKELTEGNQRMFRIRDVRGPMVSH